MAGRNKKTSVIKDIDELEKENQIEEKVEEPKAVEEPIEEVIKIEAEPVPVTANCRYKVRANPWLNVRNKPSMSGSEIIGKLNDGDIVDIFAMKDNFVKISETDEKWVNKDYLFPTYS